MELIGKEVYVEVGVIEGRWKRRKWKVGKVLKKYDGWYLVEVGKEGRSYKMGVHRMDIKLMGENIKEERYEWD